MKLSTLVIACAFAVGGSAALAQSDSSAGSSGSASGSASGSQSHGPSIVDKAKSGMHKLGDATKKAVNKVAGKDKKGEQGDTSTMGGSGSDSSSGASASSSSAKGKKQQQH